MNIEQREQILHSLTYDPAQEVKHAAEYMDLYHPGWYRRVQRDELEMGSCTQCIIGQAVLGATPGNGSWMHEMEKIFGASLVKAYETCVREFGFSMRAFASQSYQPHWVAAITDRLWIDVQDAARFLADEAGKIAGTACWVIVLPVEK